MVEPPLQRDPRIRAAAKVIYDAGRSHGWRGHRKPFEELDRIGLEEFNTIAAAALNAADNIRLAAMTGPQLVAYSSALERFKKKRTRILIWRTSRLLFATTSLHTTLPMAEKCIIISPRPPGKYSKRPLAVSLGLRRACHSSNHPRLSLRPKPHAADRSLQCVRWRTTSDPVRSRRRSFQTSSR